MADRGDEEEEKERQKLRDAARKVLQKQINTEEREDQAVDLNDVQARFPDSGVPLDNINSGQNDDLPTYEEAMIIIDTHNDYREQPPGNGRQDDGDIGNSSLESLDEEERLPSPSTTDQNRRNTLGERRDLYVVPDSGNNADTDPPGATVVDSHVMWRQSLGQSVCAEEGRSAEREEESRSRLQRFIHRRMENVSFNQLCCAFFLVTGVLAVIVFLGVFPASFVYLDYHKMALKYNKVTGVVDRSTTYEFGCYILGPSVGFLEFDAVAHTVSKTHGIFTLDKLPIEISYHVQYFIKKKELGLLHREFGSNYDEVIRSVIESEIKNLAVPFSVDQYRLQRSMLEKYFHEKLKGRLGGDCCADCCPSSCNNATICAFCPPSSSCNRAFHVNVEFFHLGRVDIPEVVTERYLTRTLLKENVDREVFIQEKMVQTTKTLQQTKKIRNTANEIQQAADAESQKIGVTASVNRDANLTYAYISALSSMFTKLNISQEDHKLSVMMIRALEDVAVKGNLYRTYGYNNGTLSLYTKNGMSVG
ncbi:uncharacterized protein LOC125672540 [Ostrea edulis]|uniref:uncharacterized protein LOC125672540 n=1 Tax=Ostrea edulis TaxID=37623 RepID=UPI0024AEDBD1|nr:uncharacterized protein LOC125672540 [Ostrea edulis]